jgi:hypothetical protein
VIQRGKKAFIQFWTGGFKRLDKNGFSWSNYDRILHEFSEVSEFCLKAVASENQIDLQDFPCENSLPFVCRMKGLLFPQLQITMKKFTHFEMLKL